MNSLHRATLQHVFASENLPFFHEFFILFSCFNKLAIKIQFLSLQATFYAQKLDLGPICGQARITKETKKKPLGRHFGQAAWTTPPLATVAEWRIILVHPKNKNGPKGFSCTPGRQHYQPTGGFGRQKWTKIWPKVTQKVDCCFRKRAIFLSIFKTFEQEKRQEINKQKEMRNDET